MHGVQSLCRRTQRPPTALANLRLAVERGHLSVAAALFAILFDFAKVPAFQRLGIA